MPDYSKHHEQAGRIGGLTRAANATNEEGRKQAAKAGFMRRFYAAVPAHITDPAERERLAHLGLRAHMARLAMKSAQRRSKPKSEAA
jgi:hypothetical protein